LMIVHNLYMVETCKYVLWLHSLMARRGEDIVMVQILDLQEPRSPPSVVVLICHKTSLAQNHFHTCAHEVPLYSFVALKRR
jgi:hypothetical protein